MSNETRFTRGPWTIKRGSETNRARAIVSDDGKPVVNWHGIARGASDGEFNACLIAAAPDLYAALEEASSMLDALPRQHNSHAIDVFRDCEACAVAKALDAARAALRRARGETP